MRPSRESVRHARGGDHACASLDGPVVSHHAPRMAKPRRTREALPDFKGASLSIGGFMAGLEQQILHKRPPPAIVVEEEARTEPRSVNGLQLDGPMSRSSGPSHRTPPARGSDRRGAADLDPDRPLGSAHGHRLGGPHRPVRGGLRRAVGHVLGRHRSRRPRARGAPRAGHRGARGNCRQAPVSGRRHAACRLRRGGRGVAGPPAERPRHAGDGGDRPHDRRAVRARRAGHRQP